MKKINRREFLKSAGRTLSAAGIGIGLSSALSKCPNSPIVKDFFDISYETDGEARTLRADVFYPVSTDKLPMIAFSSGYCGSPKLYDDMLYTFANAGYLVVAPNHNDPANLLTENSANQQIENLRGFFSDIGAIVETMQGIEGYENIDFSFLQNVLLEQCLGGEIENPGVVGIFHDFFKYRTDELSETINYVLNPDNPGFYDKINPDKIALAGHSLGGFPCIEKLLENDNRFSSALLLSPVSALSDVSAINSPTMWVTGTLDSENIRSSVKDSFFLARSPSSFVDFRGVGHLTFCAAAAGFIQTEYFFNLFRTLFISKGMFTEEQYAACIDYRRKCDAIYDAGICFLDSRIKGIGSQDDFLARHEDIVNEYLVNEIQQN